MAASNPEQSLEPPQPEPLPYRHRAGIVRFYGRLLRDTPRQLADAVNLWSTLTAGVLLVLALFNQRLASAVSSWDGVSPWWALALLVGLLMLGILRANYAEFVDTRGLLESQRDDAVRQLAEVRNTPGARIDEVLRSLLDVREKLRFGLPIRP